MARWFSRVLRRIGIRIVPAGPMSPGTKVVLKRGRWERVAEGEIPEGVVDHMGRVVRYMLPGERFTDRQRARDAARQGNRDAFVPVSPLDDDPAD